MGTGRNRWMTSAFVVVCRDGLLARDQRQRQRRAQHLATAFTLGAINGYHGP